VTVELNETNNGHIPQHIKYKIKCSSGVDMYKESTNMELPH